MNIVITRLQTHGVRPFKRCSFDFLAFFRFCCVMRLRSIAKPCAQHVPVRRVPCAQRVPALCAACPAGRVCTVVFNRAPTIRSAPMASLQAERTLRRCVRAWTVLGLFIQRMEFVSLFDVCLSISVTLSLLPLCVSLGLRLSASPPLCRACNLPSCSSCAYFRSCT